MKINIRAKPLSVTMFAMPDIAFLLLIFLILTVSADEQGNINLPDFKYVQETDFSNTIVVNVTSDGRYGISGEIMDEAGINSVLDSLSKTTVINLVADKKSRYKDVDHILESLQLKGLLDVVLIMEEEAAGNE